MATLQIIIAEGQMWTQEQQKCQGGGSYGDLIKRSLMTTTGEVEVMWLHVI